MSWTEALGPVTREPVVLAMAAAERLGSGVLFNPTAAEWFADPYPQCARLRERDPVHRSYVAGGWVLSRYEDVAAILRDARFTSEEREFYLFDRIWRRRARLRVDPEAPYRPSLLRMDDPDHARLRGLVTKAFTPRAVEKLRPRIEAIVDALLDAAATRGRLEAIGELATPLPVTVIAEMMGVPPADLARFKAWSADVIRILGIPDEPEAVRAAHRAEAQLGDYIEELAERRRREPGEDLLSALVRVEEAGEKLTMDELRRTCVLLLVAGNETTTNLIGNGLNALLRHAAEWERLCGTPALVESAVEELLRFDSPVQLTSRFATEDVVFRGRRIRRRQQVILLLGSANRDEARFREPDRLDLARRDNRHLAFGSGAHFCLGAGLARLEAQVAFAKLVRRLPRLRLADPDAPLAWRRHTLLRGLEALPVTWA